ncbi:MAG: sulfatase-like hydrolase/transferase [Halioglobus sp.]
MKKTLAVVLVLAIVGYVGWMNRVNLLVWGLPIVKNITDPIAPNVPTEWPDGPATADQSPDQRPPNIILILADDMGFNDISLYNGGAADGSVLTPHIDAIAHEGVIFENGYAANAVCAPSRASLLTGRYSTRFGFEFTPFMNIGATIFQWMYDLDPTPLPLFIDHAKAKALPPFEELGMPASEVTIAEVLKQRGYYTAHIGKWHLGSLPGMRPEDQGFDDSLYLAGTLYLPEGDANVVNAKQEGEGIDRMVWATARYAAQFNGGKKFQPGGYLTDYYTDEAIKVIEANRNRPFFLYLAHWGIHNPLQATQEDYDAFPHIENHALRVYAGMIRALDRSVGRIEQALKDNGLSENTLVVFTSDNGGAGYIGLPDINKPYRGWKLDHFEGGIHVPYMAKWPAKIQPGSVFVEPIHHVDLFQTFAAAATVKPPTDRKLDGVNLMPFVQGHVSGSPHETLFWREGYQQSVLHNGWKLIRANQPDKAPGTAQRKWLFNLAVDPTERRNLAEQHPEKVAELEALLAEHNAQQAPPMWPSVVQDAQLIDKPGGVPYEDGDEYIYWPN